jgi:hypothetical protein
MPQPLPIVSQRSMDLYYQSYKSSSQFFDLDDFIFHCGSTLADIYQNEARLKYAELRQSKSDEVVSFPADWLLEQKIKVERKDNETFATLDKPVMGFSYDNQVLGVQEVVSFKPLGTKLERTTQAARWQSDLLPFTNRVFWYAQGEKVYFFNKGGCNIQEVKVFYVPSIGKDMLVPDGVVKMVIDQTVATMKGLGQGTVVKKDIDGNQNMVTQTEMNKLALK